MKLKYLGVLLGSLLACSESWGVITMSYDSSSDKIRLHNVTDMTETIAANILSPSIPEHSVPREIGDTNSNGSLLLKFTNIVNFNRTTCFDFEYKMKLKKHGNYGSSGNALYKLSDITYDDIGFYFFTGIGNKHARFNKQLFSKAVNIEDNTYSYKTTLCRRQAEESRIDVFLTNQITSLLLSIPDSRHITLPASGLTYATVRLSPSKISTDGSTDFATLDKEYEFSLKMAFAKPTLDIHVKTCDILSNLNQTVSLRAIPKQKIANPQNREYGGSFDITLRCDEGLTPKVVFTDSMDSNNTGSYLSLLNKNGKINKGVGLELRKQGNTTAIKYGPAEKYYTRDGLSQLVSNERTSKNIGYFNFSGKTTSNSPLNVKFEAYYVNTGKGEIDVGELRGKMTYTLSYQ